MSSTFTLVTPDREATFSTTRALRAAILDYLNVEFGDESAHLTVTLDGSVDRAGGSAARLDGWAATLTQAELRLLPLLTTHMTFRAIAEQLCISRNTVKTQAISIYRKLGVSGRSAAIVRATELGLVRPSLRNSHTSL
jgi:DNA-binding NarL/FixJ family response regulator